MTDLRLVQIRTPFAITFDLLQKPGGLIDETQELATAVVVALGTDRRANADDILPDIASDDRRGWWGDQDAERIWGGWPIGSRLWLLERAKITGAGARQGATLARAEAYTREALMPFVTNKIATHIDVTAERTELDRIDVRATIYRGPLPAIELQYQTLWSELGGA